MATVKAKTAKQDHVDKAMDIAVRLAVVGLILFSGLRIVGPFIMPVAWGVIIAVALSGPFEKLKSLLGGRAKAAGGLFIAIGLAAVIIPTWLLTDSVVDGASTIGRQLEEGTFTVPPPTESVKEWPLIGEKTYAVWQGANRDLDATAHKMGPQLKELGTKFAALMASVGVAVIHTIFAIVIAGMLLINSGGGRRTAHAIAKTLAGDKGPEMVDMAASTIRSVVKGVLAVAALQSILSAVGLFIAKVPFAGLWAGLVLMLAIMQLPPLLILGPITIWVFSAGTSTPIAIFFLIWSLIISGSDGFLKPLFLGRGVEVPMLVILIGAIGGMLLSGVIGLFVGAVILAISYTLIRSWMAEESDEIEPAPEIGSAS